MTFAAGFWPALQALADWVQTQIAPLTLVFLRVGALMALLPAFGDQVVPARLRLVLAQVNPEGLVSFVLQAFGAHPPRNAEALGTAMGHLALHALRELSALLDPVD